MSKGSKKSIIANFDKFVTGEAAQPATSPMAPSPFPRPARVGAGVIGAAERSISQIVEERDRLQALVASGGGGSVELDANLVDASPFRDRLPDDDDEAFEAFKRGMEAEGQKVPVQLRRHPELDGRFQVIYGHRRVRAAKELGRPVKALVLEMSDRDLAIAQGIENSERQDLTWIERAVFAWRMEQADVKARDIRAALSVDDPELAKMRSVLRALSVEVIEMIGRAPKVGRPRWLTLAQTVTDHGSALTAIRKTLSGDKVLEASSSDRFLKALAAAAKVGAKAGAGASAPDEVKLVTGGGRPLGKAIFSGKEVRLVVDKDRSAAFTAFLKAELPALMERFHAGDDDKEHHGDG